MKNRNSCYGSSNGLDGIEQEHVEPEFSLPSLLPGSEYEFDDPDLNRRANLLGLAIAIVVQANEKGVSETDKKAWVELFEQDYKKVELYTKNLVKFWNRDNVTPMMISRGKIPKSPYRDRSLYYRRVRQWLSNSLSKAPDWFELYKLVRSQIQSHKKKRSGTDWWEKVKSVCERAETSVDDFNPISDIQKVSEKYRVKEEQVELTDTKEKTIQPTSETEQDIPPAKRLGTWTFIKKALKIFGAIIAFLAALLTIFHLLGWLEPIRAFIYNIVSHN